MTRGGEPMAWSEAVLPLAPSVVIGLGEWGGSIADRVAEALTQRSPLLAQACAVLALSREGAGTEGLIRSVLRASRRAEVVRRLAEEGLMQLDPVLPPPSRLFLVGSRVEDTDLSRLRAVAEQAASAAADLQIPVERVALIDLGETAPAALPTCGFPLYVLQPMTSSGLVLGAEEYRSVVVELLVALLQPGGNLLLGPGGGRIGTLGVAWLAWNPAAAREQVITHLGRAALAQCLRQGSQAGSEGFGADPAGPVASGGSASRAAALLRGLPFRWAAAPGGAGSLEADPGLFALPPSSTRRPHSQHLHRCAAVLSRRAQRWVAHLERNAREQAREEAAALRAAIAEALGAGPDGLASARRLAEAAARGEEAPPSPPPATPLQRHPAALTRLARLERLPPPPPVATALGLLAVLGGITMRAAGLAPAALAASLAALVALATGYAASYARATNQAAHQASATLRRQAAAALHAAFVESYAALWRERATLGRRLGAELGQALSSLSQLAENPPTPAKPAEPLGFPLVDDAALRDLARALHLRLPDLATRVATGGALRLWRNPESLWERTLAQVRDSLEGEPELAPSQLVMSAYGDRLGTWLQARVSLLLTWSRPLLGRPLPEGERWLFWPVWLPLPPTPPEVRVLPAQMSQPIAVTVIAEISP